MLLTCTKKLYISNIILIFVLSGSKEMKAQFIKTAEGRLQPALYFFYKHTIF
jgi:hypothetical protein